MVDYFVFGGAIAAAVLASITIAVLNLRSSSNLEEQTADLVATIQDTLVDQAMLIVIRSLPSGLQSLSKEQRLQLYGPMRIFSNLRTYEQKVGTIPDAAASSIVVGIVGALLAIATGFLYEIGNAIYILSLLLTAASLFMYLLWGIFPVTKIRALQRANRQLKQATTIDELQPILTRTLATQFNVHFLPLQRDATR
jgi:hypothetical protein